MVYAGRKPTLEKGKEKAMALLGTRMTEVGAGMTEIVLPGVANPVWP